MKLDNLINIASTAAEYLNKPDKTHSPSTEQNGAAQKPGLASFATNLGKNGLMGKLGAFTGATAGGKPGMGRTQLADKFEEYADKISKKNSGASGIGMTLAGWGTKLAVFQFALVGMAGILRKGEKERDKTEQVAADYYGQKHPNAPSEHAASFNPSFDEINQDLRHMPTVRIGLMEASGWQDSHLHDMKQAIDKCLRDMKSGNLHLAQKAIADFNKTSYPEHCGPMPGGAADYALLSGTIGTHLALKAAGGHTAHAHATPQNEQANASEAPKADTTDPKVDTKIGFPHYTGPRLKFTSLEEAKAAVEQMKAGGLTDADFKKLKEDVQAIAGGQENAEGKAFDFDKRYGNLFDFSYKDQIQAFGKLMLKLPKAPAAEP